MLPADGQDSQQRQADTNTVPQAKGFPEHGDAKPGQQQDCRGGIENPNGCHRVAAHEVEPADGRRSVEKGAEEKCRGQQGRTAQRGKLYEIIPGKRGQDDERDDQGGAHRDHVPALALTGGRFLPGDAKPMRTRLRL